MTTIRDVEGLREATRRLRRKRDEVRAKLRAELSRALEVLRELTEIKLIAEADAENER